MNKMPEDKRRYFPLTHAQKRVYYDDKFNPGTPVHNLSFYVRYKKILDMRLLEEAVNQVIRKNDGFRLRLVEFDFEPEPQQYVSAYKKRTFDYFDFSGPESKRRLEEWLERASQKPVELLANDLFYFALIKYNDNESGYYLKFHHIATDGWSLALIFFEINRIYGNLLQGEIIDETPNPSYIRYIAEEEAYLHSGQAQRDREFWHHTLLPLPEPLELPAKRGVPDNAKGDSFTAAFPDHIYRMIDRYTTKRRSSPFKLIFFAVAIYAARIKTIDDFVLGTVSHNRIGGDRKNTIGMFVSTIPIRIKISSNITFSELVEYVGSNINYVLKNHQNYPFDLLAGELRETTGADVGHLLDIFIVGHGNLVKEEYETNYVFQKYISNSLTIHINPNNKYQDGVLEVVYEYRLAHYSEGEIVRLHQGILNVLNDALTTPGKKISEIEILSGGEKKQLLHEFNDTKTGYPRDRTIIELFEARVDNNPGKIALKFKNENLSYKELDEKANQIADYLYSGKHVKLEEPVGIMMDRCHEFITAIMGILKAGGIYVPVVPPLPVNRMRQMISDANIGAIISHKEHIESLNHLQEECENFHTYLCTDTDNIGVESTGEKYRDDLSTLMKYGTGRVGRDIKPRNHAYVIYTSGTTGIPKGVVVGHQSLVNLCCWHHRYYEVTENDNAAQYAAFSFDASVWEIFPYLVIGAALHIVSEEIKLDIDKLNNYYERNNITIGFMPTQFCELFMKRENRSLRILLTGGDKLRIFEKRDYRLYNNYGPTENTVVTTAYRVDEYSDNIPIGAPVDNNRLYILDKENRRMQPVGVPGELCIGGESLAPGYLNEPQLTRKKFIENPVAPAGVIYKTGDLVRWLPDGNIEYLGRIDQQVKIRGFRIETGEIESKILNQKGVKEAVVVALEDKTGEKYLCGYVVSRKKINFAALQNNLAQSLPDYMIPPYFMQIDKIPLTPNGKINRKALPIPEVEEVGVVYTPPGDEIEEKLVDIWVELLRRNKEIIGIDDDFFKMGGHSLKAAVMITSIHKEFNVKVLMRDIFELSTIRKLAEYIKEAEKVKYSSITPAPPKEYYPQTSAQKRVYFMHQMEPFSILYNIPLMDIYRRGSEKGKLEQAFRGLIRRHESLRTSFHTIEGEAVQKVHDYEEVGPHFEIDYYETTVDGMIYSRQPGMEWTQVTGLPFQDVVEHFVQPFDLSKPPLLRAGLIKIMGAIQIIMLDIHHIVADGVSMVLLLEELWQLYDGEKLPPLKLQYKDFAEWADKEEQRAAIKKKEAFWLKEFGGEIPVLNLPYDYPRPTKMTFDGDSMRFEISREEIRLLKMTVQEGGETLFMVLFAAFNVLLAKLSGHEDIVAGTVTAGRGHADLHQIVGMFVETLAMRNYPYGAKTFKEFLQEVKIRTLAAFENQGYPFEELVGKVASRQDTARNPLFDVVFELENEDDRTEYLLETLMLDKSNPHSYNVKKAKFDITLVGIETKEEMRFNIEYNTHLFKEQTIERFIIYYKKIVSSICRDLNTKISDMEVISKEEKHRLLYEFNDTRAEYPQDKTIHELFAEQVNKTPGNISVVFYDPDANSRAALTYGELNRKADQLAHLLQEKGVTSGSIVGMMASKSIEMIVGLAAVLKAGGAYLPINPDYPLERKKYLFDDCRGDILLTNFENPGDFAPIVIHLHHSEIYKGEQPFSRDYSSDRLAYIIYTSGSTGKPKGVMVDHRAVVRLVKNTNYMAFKQDESILQTGALEFDASTFEIWGCLLNGLTLYLVSKDTILNGEKFKKSIRENNITTLFITSALFNQMLDMDTDIFNGLKYLLTGGDIVSAAHVNRLRQLVPGITVFNMYGPTENTTFSTFNPVERDYKANIPIGKPIANSTVYILDKGHNPVPVGVPGELYVGGCGVARGYLNNPEMTHHTFFPDPFLKDTAICPLMYATGDLARWLPTGKIEFLGRLDFQVKIRGFRIEPGEIDNRLMRLDFIEDACVVARKEPGSAHHYLCAYFSSSRKVDINELKKRLLKDLPSYMLPAYFIQMDALPLNNNGKVDRRALPDPEMEIETGDYKVPETPNEKLLAEIWQEALGIEKIGIHDDFFAIGGDSIKTVLISGRLQKRGLSVSVNDFFRNPTIKELAGHVKKVERKVHQAPVIGNVELTPIQKWYFEKDFKEKHHFNHVVTQYRSKGFDEEIIKKVFTKIVGHHDALRMVYEINEDKVTQRNRGLNEGELFSLEVIDFGDKKEFEKEMAEEVGRINKGIDLKAGPLVKLGLFRTGRGDYLMIAIHHAVVDGISWRILIQDLETACEQTEKGEEIKFQDKTDSFQYWASKLTEYANTPEQLAQLDYWKEIDALSGDYKAKKKKLKDSEVVSMNLNKEDTEKLIKEVNWVYNTEINDILLTALGMAVKEWKGNETVLIGLEGHGREGIIEGIDISRTVGWFTSQYPVLLDMKPLAGYKIQDQIKQVKETLRRIPGKGIGYGILKYLTSPGKKGGATFTLQPEISFNYLGQLDDAAVESNKKFQLKIENSMSPEFDTGYAIDIYGGAGRDGLSLSFDYNKQEYDRAGIEKLVNCFRSNLLEIIQHCMEEKEEIIRQGMSAMDYHIEKDTERYMQQIKQEEWPDLTVKNNYEHILLTGAAGFMGAHMVPELLDNTDAVLYLPVRGKTQEKAEERLKKRLWFYFGNDFFDAHKDRVVIMKAELGDERLGMDEKQYDKLCKTVDAVVHPAANVKHHGLYEELYRDNVVATENLLVLAVTGKKKDFHYVSTLDTGRGDIPGREYNFFTEYCHDVGQKTDHIYIRSKLEAEKRVLAYREKGLNGSIYRVGNLVFQSDTGIFQENIGDDYFYSIIKGAVKLEMMSENMKKIIFDMSFIDYVAKAAVLLLTRSRLKNETYHICNPNKLPMAEMAMFLEELGCELKEVKQENVADYFARFEGNSEYEKIIELFKLHSWIFEEKTGTLPVYKIDRTVTLLKKLGIEWPKITKQHIEKMIAHCKEIGFL